MKSYDFVLSSRAFHFLEKVKKAERHYLLRRFEALAARPQQEPDGFLETYPRPLSLKHFGAFRVSYWVDHPASEVRITDIVPK
jgi:hypothetical protein